MQLIYLSVPQARPIQHTLGMFAKEPPNKRFSLRVTSARRTRVLYRSAMGILLFPRTWPWASLVENVNWVRSVPPPVYIAIRKIVTEAPHARLKACVVLNRPYSGGILGRYRCWVIWVNSRKRYGWVRRLFRITWGRRRRRV